MGIPMFGYPASRGVGDRANGASLEKSAGGTEAKARNINVRFTVRSHVTEAQIRV